MTTAKKEKHFLDTSIVRPYLQSTKTYKQYLKGHFGENPLYITKYVKMEYYRGYLRNIIDFYFLLSMGSVETFGDALYIWNHKFQLRSHKATGELVANLFNTRKLNKADMNDKAKALNYLADYIKRLAIKVKRSFNNIGKDEARCARANVTLERIAIYSKAGDDLLKFVKEFDNVAKCRSQCKIDTFFLKKYKINVDNFIKYLKKLNNHSKPENKGFVKIVTNLENAMNNNKFSCHLCKIIGDAVIALETPKNMRLEHTDHSFDHFCDIINQPHFKHPNEAVLLTSRIPSQ